MESSSTLHSPQPLPSVDSPRKRRKLDDATTREPLRHLPTNSFPGPRNAGGFILDDDSEEDDVDVQSRSGRPSQQAEDYEIDTTAILGVSPKNTKAAKTAQHGSLGLDHSSPFQAQGSCVGLKDTPRPLRRTCTVRDCAGRTRTISQNTERHAIHYERIVAERSVSVPGRATTSYYGIDIHHLINLAQIETKAQSELANISEAVGSVTDSVEEEEEEEQQQQMAIGKTLLWTEKYRARKFTDLVGDERTHRSVLRWLKAWDSIVFPHQARPKAKKGANDDDQNTDRPHRKILLLTGPPGLGKTTLALICARQAGYEVQEINASDERSGNVVKGRIRDMVATENVKSVESGFDGKNKRAAKPVCVIVDEVDGVVSGSTGSGEGGFIKALVDLLVLDQRNSNTASGNQSPFLKKKKGDRFKMLRPLILICNDVYHPSLRLLRQGTIADIVHIRKPPIQMVASRLQAIFAKEGIECDGDGVRALCEATWGISNRKEDRSLNTGAGDGDMRSILVTGEWVAGKLKAVQLASKDDNVRLSKRWLTDNVFHDLAHEGGAARNLGRGGSKEVAERVFLHNAGFPSSALRTTKPSNQFRTQADMEQMPTSRDTGKKSAMQRLMQMIHASGEDDRIMSDIWTSYPAQPYQDDTILTKPSQAYDWLHFHNICSGRVHAAQEWELLPYLSYPILAFHELFAGNSRNKSATAFPVKDNDEDKDPAHPLTTIRAAYLASEAQKSNHATLTALHSILSHSLQRSFRGPEEIATDLVPYVLRILNPDVKPVVVGGSDKGIASVRKGSEKELVNRAVQAMLATGVTFDKTRIDFVVDTGNLPGGMDRTAQSAGFVYRMEPPVDHLGSFGTATKGLDLAGGKVRYAVRQVLDQEHRKEVAQVERNARQRRAHAGLSSETYDPSASTLEIVDPEVLAQQAREDAAALAKAKIDKTIKRDFFGRQVVVSSAFPMDQETARAMKQGQRSENAATGAEVRHRNDESGRVWVTYHEGYSNAVRKGITMAELLGGF